MSKTDVHLSVTEQARGAFLRALKNALLHFGDLAAPGGDWLAALHRAIEPIIPDRAHRDLIFAELAKMPAETSIADVVSAKRATDLYLAQIAKRLWPEFVKGEKNEGPPAEPAA